MTTKIKSIVENIRTIISNVEKMFQVIIFFLEIRSNFYTNKKIMYSGVQLLPFNKFLCAENESGVKINISRITFLQIATSQVVPCKVRWSFKKLKFSRIEESDYFSLYLYEMKMNFVFNYLTLNNDEHFTCKKFFFL